MSFNDLFNAPMSSRGWLTFNADGTVGFNGLRHGKATIIGQAAVPGLGLVLTIHEEGSQYWTGRGHKPGYSPAQVITVLLDRPTRRYVRLSATDLPKNAEERATRSWFFSTMHNDPQEVTAP